MLRFHFKIVLILCMNIWVSGSPDKVICYYRNWALTTFPPTDIDVKICTHINYAFLGINSDGSLRLGSSDTVLYQLKKLKEQQPNLKLMFSVGGWDEGSVNFSRVAANDQKIESMATSALNLMKIYNFDGIDIDWEYPARRGGQGSDKSNFIKMLEILNNRLKSNGSYLLSVAVEAYPDTISYDIPQIVANVDYINVMTYDLHVKDRTSENSPLYSSNMDTPWQRDFANCNVSIANWQKLGAPSRKLILGLAFYGFEYILQNPKEHEMGAPVNGTKGSISYNNICTLKDGWTEVWDDEQKVPYKYNDQTWIGFDNSTSIKLKVQFAKDKGLGGVMMWAVDQDTRNEDCGEKHVLLKAIANA